MSKAINLQWPLVRSLLPCTPSRPCRVLRLRVSRGSVSGRLGQESPSVSPREFIPARWRGAIPPKRAATQPSGGVPPPWLQRTLPNGGPAQPHAGRPQPDGGRTPPREITTPPQRGRARPREGRPGPLRGAPGPAQGRGGPREFQSPLQGAHPAPARGEPALPSCEAALSGAIACVSSRPRLNLELPWNSLKGQSSQLFFG